MTDPATKQHRLARHNVVAAFADWEPAGDALEKLRSEGFTDEELSFVTRDVVPAEGDSFEEPHKLGVSAAEGVGKGGLLGLGVGGAAGFIAGALAFGIPGIGPAVGAGIWAATAGGAAAGATAGGLVGAFGHMWDAQYHAMVREGRTLVGVHTDDRARADRAYGVLDQRHPLHVSHFDAEGAVIHETVPPPA